MRLPRVLLSTELEPGARCTLSPHAQGHLVRVLRLRTGAALRVFDGRGAEALAELLDPQTGSVRIIERRAAMAPAPLSIVLMQALARGEKMDLILQKATELGVARVLPVHTERSEVKLDEDRAGRRMAHWQGVLAGACEQCGRAELPLLDAPQSLAQALVSADLPVSRWYAGSAVRAAGGRPRRRLWRSRPGQPARRGLPRLATGAAGTAHRDRRTGRPGGIRRVGGGSGLIG